MTSRYICERCALELALEDVTFRDLVVNHPGFKLHYHLCSNCDAGLMAGLTKVFEQVRKEIAGEDK